MRQESLRARRQDNALTGGGGGGGAKTARPAVVLPEFGVSRARNAGVRTACGRGPSVSSDSDRVWRLTHKRVSAACEGGSGVTLAS